MWREDDGAWGEAGSGWRVNAQGVLFSDPCDSPLPVFDTGRAARGERILVAAFWHAGSSHVESTPLPRQRARAAAVVGGGHGLSVYAIFFSSVRRSAAAQWPVRFGYLSSSWRVWQQWRGGSGGGGGGGADTGRWAGGRTPWESNICCPEWWQSSCGARRARAWPAVDDGGVHGKICLGEPHQVPQNRVPQPRVRPARRRKKKFIGGRARASLARSETPGP